MKSQITRDQLGRIYIETENGDVTVIPSDFSTEEIMIEAATLHRYSETSDSLNDWESKLIG